jgi:hypothetical protein
MHFGNHHLWWLGCSLGMEGLIMDEQVKAGEWIGKHLFAFPANHFDLADSEHGMTLRDYFAAKAMHAFLSKPSSITCPDELIAEDAYNTADAMMKERKK